MLADRLHKPLLRLRPACQREAPGVLHERETRELLRQGVEIGNGRHPAGALAEEEADPRGLRASIRDLGKGRVNVSRETGLLEIVGCPSGGRSRLKDQPVKIFSLDRYEAASVNAGPGGDRRVRSGKRPAPLHARQKSERLGSASPVC